MSKLFYLGRVDEAIAILESPASSRKAALEKLRELRATLTDDFNGVVHRRPFTHAETEAAKA